MIKFEKTPEARKEMAKEIAAAEAKLMAAMTKQLQAGSEDVAKDFTAELDRLADQWTQLRVSAAGERKEVVRRFMSQAAQDRIERRDDASHSRSRAPQSAKRAKRQMPVVSGSAKRSNAQEEHEVSGQAKRSKIGS